MKHPQHDDMARQLINSAEQAAKDLRREQGLLSRLLAFFEQRAERRHELQKLAMEQQREDSISERCRAGKHDVQGWKHVQDTDVYAETAYSTTSKLPIKRKRTWQGHCIHCGSPAMITREL